MKKHRTITASFNCLGSLVLLSFVTSCTPYQQQGAAIGALGGAGLGAIAGNDGGDVVTGAALGAAAGAGVSAYREDQQRRANTPNYRPPSQDNRPQSYTPPADRPTYRPPAPSLPSTSTPARTSSGEYPMARPALKPGTVISPYPPYNVLNVEGAASGTRLCDPSTIPIDPSTGRQYINPATGQPDVKRGKYFIVP